MNKNLLKTILFCSLVTLPTSAAQRQDNIQEGIQVEAQLDPGMRMILDQLNNIRNENAIQIRQREETNKLLRENNEKLEEEVVELKKKNIEESYKTKIQEKRRIKDLNRSRQKRRNKKETRAASKKNKRELYRNKLCQDWKDECEKVDEKAKKDCLISIGLGAASVTCAAFGALPVAFALWGAEAAKCADGVLAERPEFEPEKVEDEVQLRYPFSDENISDDERMPAYLRGNLARAKAKELEKVLQKDKPKQENKLLAVGAPGSEKDDYKDDDSDANDEMNDDEILARDLNKKSKLNIEDLDQDIEQSYEFLQGSNLKNNNNNTLSDENTDPGNNNNIGNL